MFRNVRLYRVNGAWPESEAELSQALSRAAFKPCGAYAEHSSGWEAPTGDPDGALCRRVSGADLLRLRSQSRLLPAAAVEEALEQRLEEYRQRMQQEPGRREKRRLKEQTRDELLPKALLKSDRTHGFCLVAERILGIDTGSEARAEHFLDMLRSALGGLDAAPLTFDRPVARLLSDIFLGSAPRPFTLGRECRLQDPSDVKATVRCVSMDLTDPAVRHHVKDGMELTHLGIEVGQALSCVLDQHGVLSKLKLAGGEDAEDADDQDPLARLDAQFVLLTGTLRELIGTLDRVLGGDRPAEARASA
ncbi:MAG TPA: recombination-associated protein RdgC [Gammaproteobacteria bacterium]|nr:recombination-associated protein RdgC [Gammaproteobacteria bacterium]